MRIHSFLIEFNRRNLHIGEKGDTEFLISAKTISRNKNTETPLHILTFFFFQILTFYMEGIRIICTSCWENKRMHDAAHSLTPLSNSHLPVPSSLKMNEGIQEQL